MNYTNITNPTTQAKLFVAMNKARQSGIAQYVTNRNNEPVLRVKPLNKPTKLGSKSVYFAFHGKGNKDLTKDVYKAFKINNELMRG